MSRSTSGAGFQTGRGEPAWLWPDLRPIRACRTQPATVSSKAVRPYACPGRGSLERGKSPIQRRGDQAGRPIARGQSTVHPSTTGRGRTPPLRNLWSREGAVPPRGASLHGFGLTCPTFEIAALSIQPYEAKRFAPTHVQEEDRWKRGNPRSSAGVTQRVALLRVGNRSFTPSTTGRGRTPPLRNLWSREGAVPPRGASLHGFGLTCPTFEIAILSIEPHQPIRFAPTQAQEWDCGKRADVLTNSDTRPRTRVSACIRSDTRCIETDTRNTNGDTRNLLLCSQARGIEQAVPRTHPNLGSLPCLRPDGRGVLPERRQAMSQSTG